MRNDEVWLDDEVVAKAQPCPKELYGALDVTDACKGLDYRLNSWTKYVALMSSNSYQTMGQVVLPTGRRFLEVEDSRHFVLPRGATSIVTQYAWDRMQEQAEEARQLRAGSSSWHKDERPYFTDPIQLMFDPRVASRNDDGKDHDGISFRRLWKDPLARTLWMVMKGRYLTNQYFRRICLNQAYWIRKKPPLASDDLYFRPDTGASWLESCPKWFYAQTYPYIVRVLVNEKRWPYFIPCRLPDKPLGWVRVKRTEQ